MAEPKLAKLELQIMDVLWTRSKASIREIQGLSPKRTDRPTRRSKQLSIVWKPKRPYAA